MQNNLAGASLIFCRQCGIVCPTWRQLEAHMTYFGHFNTTNQHHQDVLSQQPFPHTVVASPSRPESAISQFSSETQMLLCWDEAKPAVRGGGVDDLQGSPPITTQFLFECSLCGFHFFESHELDEHMAQDHTAMTSNDLRRASNFSTMSDYSQQQMQNYYQHHNSSLQFSQSSSFSSSASFSMQSQLLDQNDDFSSDLDDDTEQDEDERRAMPPPPPAADVPKACVQVKETRISNKPVNTDKKTCEICGKIFNQRRTLLTHMRVHTGEKPYVCAICGQAFRQATHRNSHAKTHNPFNGNAFPCKICGKGFARKYSLTIHELIHNGVYPYACEYCDKQFRRLEDKKRHEIRHTGTFKHLCTSCPAKFATRSCLNRHLRIHEREKKALAMATSPSLEVGSSLVDAGLNNAEKQQKPSDKNDQIISRCNNNRLETNGDNNSMMKYYL